MPKAIPRATMRGSRVDIQARNTVSMSEKAASIPAIKARTVSFKFLITKNFIKKPASTQSASNLAGRQGGNSNAPSYTHTLLLLLLLLLSWLSANIQVSSSRRLPVYTRRAFKYKKHSRRVYFRTIDDPWFNSNAESISRLLTDEASGALKSRDESSRVRCDDKKRNPCLTNADSYYSQERWEQDIDYATHFIKHVCCIRRVSSSVPLSTSVLDIFLLVFKHEIIFRPPLFFTFSQAGIVLGKRAVVDEVAIRRSNKRQSTPLIVTSDSETDCSGIPLIQPRDRRPLKGEGRNVHSQ